MRKIARRYQVEKQIAEQPLFTLSTAIDTKENKQVLVQELSALALARPLESLLRYRKVTEKLQEVKHGNILQVIESGQEENSDYTIYEYYDSNPLTEYQHATLAEKIEFFLSTVRGLEAAHLAKILHGGLNPLSILVSDKVVDVQQEELASGKVVENSESVVSGKVVKEISEQKDRTTIPLYPTQQTLAGRHSTTASHIKLTGFGLNLLSDLTKITTPEEIRNVFGYLSPEGTGILRKPLDQRSDLYSLGIVFYELFSGQLPYQSTEVAELIHQHIAMTPAPPSAINPEIPVVIEKMVLRLIAKDPQDRYQSAAGLIYDLEEYQRRVVEAQKRKGTEAQSKESVIPEAVIGNPVLDVRLIDFEIARQDRLRELNFSTRLIGREKELKSLKDNLKRATVGQGSVSLVSGEAGIGKSRLIDELRSEVHQKRGIFAGGKCYQYEFQTPYKVISEAIEAYIEKVKRQSQQEQQAVIKRIKEGLGELGGEAVKIAPALKELIGEPPALVSLEPEKEKIRFLITVTNFILSLSSKENPLLLFLDDLQWVDDGSLEILERVMQKVPESSLMLIIGYRSNEVDENHILAKMLNKISDKVVENSESVVSGKVVKEEQKDTTTVPLYHSITAFPIKPFDLPETAKMISQIILEPVEQVLYLAENLYERTKGNPFFTLELLRTLYEEKIIYLQDNHYTFDREQLGKASLPTNVVDIVLKRMKDISEGEKQILSAASVMGKEIDLQLLTQLSQKSFEHILSVIEHSIENQLLYRDITGKEATYFIHDRVREAFYQRIPEDEKAPMHRYIAEAIEIQHKDNLQEVLYDLAFHYTQGKVEEKALEYSLKAGRQAQASYSNTLAISLYNTAKEILEKQNKTKEAKYIDILESLGEVYRLAGKFEESLQVLKKCESLIPKSDIMHRARVMSMIGDTLFDSGRTDESAKILEQALRTLKIYIPNTLKEVFLGIGIQFSIHILHSLFPKILIREIYKEDIQKIVNIRIMIRLAHMYYFSSIYKAVYCVLRFLNLAEKLGPCRELARAYVTTIPLWIVFPWQSRAERYFKKGIEMSQKFNDQVSEGIGYSYYAVRCFIGNKGTEGVLYAQKGINRLKPLGEYYDLGIGYAFYSINSIISGNLQDSIRNNEESIDIMKSTKALQALGYGYFFKGYLYSLIGDISNEIIEDIKESIRLMIETRDRANEAYSLSILAYAYLRRKEYILAMETIEKVVPIYSRLKGTWSWDMFTIGAQIYLDTITKSPELSVTRKKKYLRRAKWYNNRAIFLSLTGFPYIRGWTYQVWGTYNWLFGRKRRAEKLWDQGLRWLRTNKNNPGGDKYRIAYLLLEEAKCLLEPDTKASAKEQQRRNKKAHTNLIEARDLFESMGCVLDLQTTTELLDQIIPEGTFIDSRAALSQKRHFESLLNVSAAIGSVFDLKELLDKIMAYAIKVTGAERGFLLLYANQVSTSHIDSGRVLELKVSQGLEQELQGIAFSYDEYKISLQLVKEVEGKQEALIVESSESEEGNKSKIQNSNSKINSNDQNSNKQTKDVSTYQPINVSTALPAKVYQELQSYQVKQALAVPLKAKDKMLGIIYLDNRLAQGTFSQNEMELLKAFSVQSAISIENTRLVSEMVEQERLKQELELGREIQMNLLPQETPRVEGLKIGGLMIPAKEIGGDYYDYIVTSNKVIEVQQGETASGKVVENSESVVSGKVIKEKQENDTTVPLYPTQQTLAGRHSTTDRLSIVIGDVSGKGVGAGLIMATAKSTIEAISMQGLTPKGVLSATNKLLGKYTKHDKFMTMLYFEWVAAEKTLKYSSAGHEHIIIYRSGKVVEAQQGEPAGDKVVENSESVVSGKVVKGISEQKDTTTIPLYPSTTGSVEVIPSGGFVLGMLPDIEEMLEDKELKLNSGDKVVLYTDGVTEAHNEQGQLYELQRLAASVKRHGSQSGEYLLGKLKEDVFAFMGKQEQYDDITMVVMEAE